MVYHDLLKPGRKGQASPCFAPLIFMAEESIVTTKGRMIHKRPVERISHQYHPPGHEGLGQEVGFNERFSFKKKFEKQIGRRKGSEVWFSHRAKGRGNSFLKHLDTPVRSCFFV